MPWDDKGVKSSLFNEFLFAFGAGDGDFSLSPGYSNRLAAPGTVKIPMLPVFDPLHKFQILPIFLIPLVGVPGKHPENRPNHQSIGQNRDNKI